MLSVNYPDETAKNLAGLAEDLHKRYFQYIPDLKRRYPFHKHADFPEVVGKVNRVTKSADGREYVCYFRPQYFIKFSSGRFAAGTKYERDPPVISDTSVVRSISEDYVNSNSEPLTKTRKITKSITRSKTISAEKVFRALASAEVGVEIKFFTAGGKTEAEFTTTHSESESMETVDTVEEEMPITIPPNSTMRYTESAERVTSRQTLRAKGIMDWEIYLDIYNMIGITWESMEQLHLFMTGQLAEFPYGRVQFGDTRRSLYDWCQGRTRIPPSKELQEAVRPSDQVRSNIQEVVLKTEDARTGVTKLEPI